MSRSNFDLIFAPETIEHVKAIDRAHHSVIRRAINEQLRSTPDVETRNRKPLESPAPFAATWELRCEPDNRFRVLYEIEHKQKVVSILAIGIKDRNRMLIGGKEFK